MWIICLVFYCYFRLFVVNRAERKSLFPLLPFATSQVPFYRLQICAVSYVCRHCEYLFRLQGEVAKRWGQGLHFPTYFAANVQIRQPMDESLSDLPACTILDICEYVHASFCTELILVWRNPVSPLKMGCVYFAVIKYVWKTYYRTASIM